MRKYEDIFKSVNQQLKTTVNPLREQAFLDDCINFLHEAGISISLDTKNDLPDVPSSAGIYLFWINLEGWHKNQDDDFDNLLSLFEDDWSKPATNISYTPKFNKGNSSKILQNISPDDWIPLYIGKSENIKSRVIQHIELEENKKTYALKLNARKSNLEGAKIELNWLPLEVCDENYFIVELVESLLRKKILPIIGKQ